MPVAIAPALTIEEQEAQWISDFKAYSRDQLFIQPLPDPNDTSLHGAQLKRFTLNEPQLMLDQIINEIRADGRLVRIIILKARREGMSTYVSGRFYWMTTTRWNRYSLLITHEPEATEFLFAMHKRFLQNNPIWKPQITYNNKKLLNFDTPDGKGLGSAIRVATAGKEHIGSGQAVHYLHLSEMAKWPSHTTEAIMTSVSQCVPRSADTEVIIESTAKGVGGEFYDRYDKARYWYDIVLKDGKPRISMTINAKADPQNEYSRIFFPWFVFGAYQMDPGQQFVRTAKEQEMAVTYGITDWHLAWRRWCISNNCNGSEDTFCQEYPSNSTEAFLATGAPVFSTQQLTRLIASAPEPKLSYTIRVTDGQFIANKMNDVPKAAKGIAILPPGERPAVIHNGEFKVWEEPIPGEEYIVSGDVSEGINRNTSGRVADYSCAQVWRCSTGEQVAEWHGKIDPDQFGMIMVFIGRRYNTAWLVPERNNHGNATVLKIVDMRYPKIYVERVPEPPNQFRKRFGWLTTRNNKRDIVDNLVAEMRDGTHGIKSVETFREMLSFKQEGQEYGADVGKFDDRVMTALIAKSTMPLLRSRRYRRDATHSYTSSRSDAAVPASAWML